MIKRSIAALLITTAFFILLALLSAVIRAAGGQDAGYHYVLAEGTTYRGDLTIAAQDVKFQAGSLVEGNVSIVALSKVTLAGRINGKLSILAPVAEVQLDPGLVVQGDLAICARSLSPLDNLKISGKQDTGCDQLDTVFNGSYSSLSTGSGLPSIPLPILTRYSGDLFTRLLQIGVTSFVLAAIAALLMTFFPGPLRRINEAVLRKPRTAGLTGLLSMGTLISLTLLYMVLTVVTLGLLCVALPVVAGAWLLVTVALVVGWIAISLSVGRILVRRLKITGPPMITAALGVLALTLAQGLIEMLPCVGWISTLLLLVLSAVGLGAVILTRLGTRAYPEIIRRSVI